jgi:hypothetical protein
MGTVTKLDALISLRPNAKFVYSDGEIIWNDEIETQPTELEINAKLTELQADYDAKEYQRKRAAEYPSIGDQLDKLWHSINADDTLKTQFADFYNTIKAVKDKYPKE